MKISLLTIIFLICGSCVDSTLISVKECNEICYTGPLGTQNVGTCIPGRWLCTDKGQSCEGQVLPSVEVACDSLDNDCNGIPHLDDTDLDGDSITFCQGDCAPTNPNIGPNQPELCNNIDDNCNGLVDDPTELVVKFCYPGAKNTILQGECHPGTLRCSKGQETCVGYQLPQSELCDGLDNDCDGQVDEGLNQPTDFVFIIDESGSMASVIEGVKKAISDHTQNALDSSRYALVVAPSKDENLDGQVMLVTNFTNATNFSSIINNRGTGYSGLEPSYDALAMVAKGSAFPLEDTPTLFQYLNWRSEARQVVIFLGDEKAQSNSGITEEQVSEIFSFTKINLFIFTQLIFFDNYNEILAQELSLLNIDSNLEQGLKASALLYCDK